MASNEKPGESQDSAVSIGERRQQRRRAEDAAKIATKLSLEEDDKKAFDKDRGSDPYNTGGFDRKNNWTRVGKR